jgi:hypothetical protein
MHDIFVKLFSNRLFLAPVDLTGMSQVLDMGTGTGICMSLCHGPSPPSFIPSNTLSGAMEIADRFPNLTIVGNDLSPVQPAWVPSNVHFVVDDLEMPWRYDTPFDFVFGRYLLASIEDWPKLVGSAYELALTDPTALVCLDANQSFQKHPTGWMDRARRLRHGYLQRRWPH